MTASGDLCERCQHPRRSHIYDEGACRPGFVCEAGCKAFVGDRDLHPLKAGTARRIAAWIREQGDVYRPISESRAIECEHGSYGWQDCGECSMIQLADAIERGEWQNGGAA